MTYAENDGTVSWATNWIETNDNNNPAAGLILITGGRFRSRTTADANPSTIEREADLTGNGFATATLSFTYRTSGALVAGDVMLVQISPAGAGGPWTTLGTFAGAQAASNFSQALTPAQITATTRIRFVRSTGYNAGGKTFIVDNACGSPPRVSRPAIGKSV